VETMKKILVIKQLNLADDLIDLIRLHKSINSEDSVEKIKSHYQNYCGKVYMLHYDNKIIGFSALSNHLWNQVSIIEQMAIDRDFQGKGFGKELLYFVISNAEERGDRFITVQTATWNTKGIKFYEREGFKSKVVFEKYFGNNVDMIWLEMRLNKTKSD